jgi:response regulator RpfG family c-di-GMP phosphodiesterase
MTEAFVLRDEVLADTGGIAVMTELEEKSLWTAEHSYRVGSAATYVAVTIGMGTKRAATLGVAGVLHDVGKLDDRIVPLLRLTRSLSPSETALMRFHPLLSYARVSRLKSASGNTSNLDIVEEANELLLVHHEPTNDLLEDAVLLQIADQYDALSFKRPYRQAATPQYKDDHFSSKFEGVTVMGLQPLELVRLLDEYVQIDLPATA